MKQIIQNYLTGNSELAEVPVPLCTSTNFLKISPPWSDRNRAFIMILEKKSYWKSKSGPDLVKPLWISTEEVWLKLKKPWEAWYAHSTRISSAGMVMRLAAMYTKSPPVTGLHALAPLPSHADYVTIPENLCCKIPDFLMYEEATFVCLALSPFMYQVRKLTFGEIGSCYRSGAFRTAHGTDLKAYDAASLA